MMNELRQQLLHLQDPGCADTSRGFVILQRAPIKIKETYGESQTNVPLRMPAIVNKTDELAAEIAECWQMSDLRAELVFYEEQTGCEHCTVFSVGFE